MNAATPNARPASAPPAGPAPGRQSSPASTGGSGLFTLLWLLFLAVLVVNPARLDAVWSWFRDLPTIAQVVGWVLFLPLVIGLAIWQAPWALWVRVTLIVTLALANIIVFSPKTTDRGTR